MGFINLEVAPKDEVFCPKDFVKLLGRFAFCLLCEYVRRSVMICLIVNRMPKDVHIGGSFLIIRWLWEI